ncbi:MAG TPA: SIR2 family protein [Streptosporangiaceae bacterium]|nr:SIR2 family protein [Streptosporangiaceae bacterium]
MDPIATGATMDAPDPVPVPVFARGFALRASQTAWLVGAGASADAGVPTASQLIDELLAVLYCSENGIRRPDLERDPRWQNLVRTFYDGRHGLPAIADSSFYSAIFEKVYPDRDARARFIMAQLDGRRPHPGQHMLAALVAAEMAPVVITPNFETLVEDAVRPALDSAAGGRLTVLDPESSTRVPFTMATDARPLLIKIHGDLGTVTLRNTSAELAEQDRLLRAATLSLLNRYGLIVVGYSGRDPAVMEMLRDALEHPTPYPGGLTWVHRPEDPLSEEVRGFLAAARAAGVEPVHEVEAGGMMELMAEIERAVTLPPRVAEHLALHRPKPLRYPAPPPTGPVRDDPHIRLAALPLLSIPHQARLLEGPTGTPLNILRQTLRACGARAVLCRRTGGQLVAFGDDNRLALALAVHGVQVSSDTVPLGSGKDDEEPDSTDIGLIAETLAKALGRTRGITEILRSGQRHMLRARDDDPRHPEDKVALAGLRNAVGGPVTGYLPGPGGTRLPWAEAITLAVDWRQGTWRLLFAPEIWVRPNFTDPPAGFNAAQARDAAAKLGAEFARTRIATRYNSMTGSLLTAWVQLLTNGGARGTRIVYAFGLQPGAGIDAAFTLGTTPLMSRPQTGAPFRSNA